MYFCPKCKRNHRQSSSVYKKHQQFEKVESDNIPSKKVISCVFSTLPAIARRQIKVYIRKMVWDKNNNFSKKREMYIKEINRVILEEGQNDFLLK